MATTVAAFFTVTLDSEEGEGGEGEEEEEEEENTKRMNVFPSNGRPEVT